ncbi:hypothetical protein SEA_ISSMI_58 [Streptomyces phage Issmi]|uniref:Uncharacterized protein n=1 Tax=Streptomyces phage Issmi TaxID=2725628 RepID=A0A6M3TAN7_9CAUD|nr:hypothetical protein KGG87_gp58 [Streptomyces phage Issmi]QJD50704.1 hypothetical protein SEA_ISSMI_58 [Streptomyces phage Issmi]
MVNGWDWIDEGQRIAEDSRRAGELDLDAIKASSIVFEQPLDSQTLEFRAPQPPQVGGFVEELHALKNEVDICRAGHCTSGYTAVRLGDEVKRLRAELARLKQTQPRTVAALHEALTHLGEV